MAEGRDMNMDVIVNVNLPDLLGLIGYDAGSNLHVIDCGVFLKATFWASKLIVIFSCFF